MALSASRSQRRMPNHGLAGRPQSETYPMFTFDFLLFVFQSVYSVKAMVREPIQFTLNQLVPELVECLRDI